MTPNDPYMGRTAPLTSKRCILYIYSTNAGTEHFKHALHSPFFSLQNAVCFIMLTCLVSVLFTFYIQSVLKLKKNNSGARGLNDWPFLWKNTVSYVRYTLKLYTKSIFISFFKGLNSSISTLLSDKYYINWLWVQFK